MIYLKIVGYILVGIVILVVFISSLNLTYREFKNLEIQAIKRNEDISADIITEDDLENLPHPVREYLCYVGIVGTPKVISYHVSMTGKFKMNQDQDFSDATIEQVAYNNESTRLFYMRIIYNHLKVAGIHHFENKQARMTIKLLDIIKIVNETGDIMNQSETVTIFNDMAILAPATLIDKRITWESIDDYHVKGYFTLGNKTVSAIFTFNESYQLINFVSEDRYLAKNQGEYEKTTWSTPITSYKQNNGFNLPYEGSAIWHLENESFEYIKLNIEQTIYNKEIK